MKKQYGYISQEDLDNFTSILRKRNLNQKDSFGIPLEFAVKFWGKDSIRGQLALAQQGFNVAGAGSIDSEIESAFFQVIREQKEKKVCFSTLGEAMEGMSDNKDFFICGSFEMDMNYRQSSFEFIQLESDYAPCTYKEDKIGVRIVMGMSVSKMLMSMGELQDQMRAGSFDIWGRIYKINHGSELPSFQFKPFVVGFNWIPSLNLE